jgi:Mce-associated membrane protein
VADKTSEAAGTVDETAADETAAETSTTAAETPQTADETNSGADGTTAETNADTGETDADTGETGTATDETPDETDTATDETDTATDEIPDETNADTGETTAETDAHTDETGATAGETGTADGSRRIRVAAIALGAATVVLGAFGVWATLEAHSLRAGAAPQNVAVTDGAATSAVNRQIVSAVNKVFSYNYADTAATRQAAQGLLTGPAIHQYDTYFALVAKDAPSQKLVVTTRVTNSGVELLAGNQARVLVFANQQDTRAGTSQTSYAGALFAVTAVRQGNRWKIENIDTFNGQ